MGLYHGSSANKGIWWENLRNEVKILSVLLWRPVKFYSVISHILIKSQTNWDHAPTLNTPRFPPHPDLPFWASVGECFPDLLWGLTGWVKYFTKDFASACHVVVPVGVRSLNSYFQFLHCFLPFHCGLMPFCVYLGWDPPMLLRFALNSRSSYLRLWSTGSQACATIAKELSLCWVCVEKSVTLYSPP